jgi:hypothetical protein
MALNLLKKYSNLLELAHLEEKKRNASLYGIFARDIENNNNFLFKKKQIWPMKIDGQPTMQTLFNHLIKKDDKDDKGQKLGSRSYDVHRSQRLHWLLHHVYEGKCETLDIFSYEDRINSKSIIRTYIYNKTDEYVVIMEPQRTKTDYTLITAYHLNEPGGKKQIENKLKKKLNEVY